MDPLVDVLLIRCGTAKYVAVMYGHGGQDRAIVGPMLVKKPAFGRIDDSAPYVRFCIGLDGCHIELQSCKGPDARNHPYQRQVQDSAVGIATTDIAMRTREPCLLDMAPWLLALRYRP